MKVFQNMCPYFQLFLNIIQSYLIIIIATQTLLVFFMNSQQNKNFESEAETLQMPHYQEIDYLINKYDLIEKTPEDYSDAQSFSIRLVQIQMMELKISNKQYSLPESEDDVEKGSDKLTRKTQFLKKLTFCSEIYTYDDYKNKKKLGYIWDRFISIGDKKMSIHQIIKLKCLKDQFVGAYRLLKVVNTQENSYFFFANASKKQQNSKMGDHYLWFAKILSAKLQSMKYLIKFRQPFGGSLDKISKTNLQQPTLIEGFIYKRSKYLQEWKKRYIIITKKCLLSYKEKEIEYSFSINYQDIRYMWTRFDIYEGFVVLKLKHNLIKTQFAIPVVDSNNKSFDSWITAFYQLMIY